MFFVSPVFVLYWSRIGAIEQESEQTDIPPHTHTHTHTHTNTHTRTHTHIHNTHTPSPIEGG